MKILTIGLAFIMLAWGYLGFLWSGQPDYPSVYGSTGRMLSIAQMIFGAVLLWLRINGKGE